MSQKIVTISMQNSEGNGFGDPWQILSSTFLKSSVFCYVELTLTYDENSHARGHSQPRPSHMSTLVITAATQSRVAISTYIPSLNGFRAMSILLVLLVHLN